MPLSIWSEDSREFINKALFNEIKKDIVLEPKKVIDIGCGNGYLLNFFRDEFNSQIFCIEKQEFCQKSNFITYLDIKDLDMFIGQFDIIALVDVLYFFDINFISDLFRKLRLLTHRDSLIYIVTGIYNNSKAIELFEEDLNKIKAIYGNIYIHDLNELHKIFSQNFKVYYKRFNFNDIFGFNISQNMNPVTFLKYIYEEKLIIKLTQ